MKLHDTTGINKTKTGKYWTLFGEENIDGLAMFWSRHDGLLHEITEGKMKGKPTRGRRRIQMLHDLANDGGSVALKKAAELMTERDGDTQKGSQKPAVQQKTTDDELGVQVHM